MKKNLFLAILATFLVTGCTKKSDDNSSSASGGSNEVTISVVGETMAYDKTEFTVKAGQPVTLTLKNPSTTQKHNWVLAKPGKGNDVGIAGISAGEAKGFIPDSPDVLAHTKLVAPGAQDTITFTAPAAGDYPFNCTFPGHHTIMKGIMKSVN